MSFSSHPHSFSNHSQVPLKAEGTDASRVGSEFVVLDAAGRMLRGLNPTGARVWELIDGQRSVAEIASCVADEFKVMPELALRDVVPFVTQLAQRRLLMLNDGPLPSSAGDGR